MAINFPATGGQPTDGSFTYTVAGITYSWNGESWTAAGAGASATDRSLFSATTASAGTTALTYDQNTGVFEYTPPDLSTYLTAEADTLATVTGRGASTNPGVQVTFNDIVNVMSGLRLQTNGTLDIIDSTSTGGLDIQTDYSLQIGQNGFPNQDYATFDTGGCTLFTGGTNRLQTTSTGVTITGALTAGGLTFPITNGNANDVLTSDGTGGVTWTAAAGLQIRQSISVAGTITGGAFSNSSVNMAKTVALLSIQSNSPAWVVLYADTASRTNDANRSRNTSPAPGSGVIAEVIFTSAGTQILTPGVIGFSPTSSTTYYTKMTNDGPTGNVSVDFTYLQLEA